MVVAEGTAAHGHSFVDRRGPTPEGVPLARVLLDVDGERFKQVLVKSITSIGTLGK